MDLIRIEETCNNFKITADIVKTGEDLVIIIGGGKYHIGAVGISYPTASIIEKERDTVTTSVITLPGHKEDIVAKMFSEKISKALNRKVVTVAGIHFDNISKDDIEKILRYCERLCEKVIQRLKDEGGRLKK